MRAINSINHRGKRKEQNYRGKWKEHTNRMNQQDSKNDHKISTEREKLQEL
jgi:hypothetical protein